MFDFSKKALSEEEQKEWDAFSKNCMDFLSGSSSPEIESLVLSIKKTGSSRLAVECGVNNIQHLCLFAICSSSNQHCTVPKAKNKPSESQFAASPGS